MVEESRQDLTQDETGAAEDWVEIHNPGSEPVSLLGLSLTDDLTDRVNAGNVVRELAPLVGGRGGGRPNLAQAGGPDVDQIDAALQKAPDVVEKLTAS